jgi:hypothetical protein
MQVVYLNNGFIGEIAFNGFVGEIVKLLVLLMEFPVKINYFV